jgi:hypothetical protein
VLSVIILGTVVSLPEILGGLLVMLGLMTTVYGRSQELETNLKEAKPLPDGEHGPLYSPIVMEGKDGEDYSQHS